MALAMRPFNTYIFCLICICLASCALWSEASPCWSQLSKEEFPSCQQLASVYSLHWKIDDGWIRLGVVISTPVIWAGVGISEAGGMKGADIMLLQQNSSGAWTVTDMFSTDYERPVADKQQDVTLLSATYSNETLVATLQRPLITCDDDDHNILTSSLQQHVIWAYGKTSTFQYHGPINRGNALVSFVSATKLTTQTDPPDTTPLDVLMPSYVPSTAATTYACTFIKVPAGPKRHLIRYKSIVTNPAVVHHMIMYGCQDAPETPEGAVTECLGMPAGCQTFYLGWVPGVTDLTMPEEAAFPLAGTGINWLALQVHYNNPNRLALPADASGFRIFLTQQLRPNDIGVLMIGQPDFTVPASTAAFSTLANICPSSCTSQFPANLTIISTAPHMHQIGRTFTTRRVRNGTELKPLTTRKYWDFNYQQMDLPTPQDTLIMPGDALITTCSYDSIGRTTATKYGEESTNEMCWNFIAYYPAMPSIDICVGSNSLPYATCTTRYALSMVDPQNYTALLEYVNQGKFVPAKMDTYTPFQAVCTRSATGSPTRTGTNTSGTPPSSTGSISPSSSPRPATVVAKAANGASSAMRAGRWCQLHQVAAVLVGVLLVVAL